MIYQSLFLVYFEVVMFIYLATLHAAALLRLFRLQSFSTFE